jgi:hypothetical protein
MSFSSIVIYMLRPSDAIIIPLFVHDVRNCAYSAVYKHTSWHFVHKQRPDDGIKAPKHVTYDTGKPGCTFQTLKSCVWRKTEYLTKHSTVVRHKRSSHVVIHTEMKIVTAQDQCVRRREQGGDGWEARGVVGYYRLQAYGKTTSAKYIY